MDAVSRPGEIRLQTHQAADAQRTFCAVTERRSRRDHVAAVVHGKIQIQRGTRRSIDIFEFDRLPLAVRKRKFPRLRLFGQNAGARKHKVGRHSAVGAEQNDALLPADLSACDRKQRSAAAAKRVGRDAGTQFLPVIDQFCRIGTEHHRGVFRIQPNVIALLFNHTNCSLFAESGMIISYNRQICIKTADVF